MQNMNQYATCEITSCLMDYVCVYPECLKQNEQASVNCYKCLCDNHKHHLHDFDHLIKLPVVLQQSQENIVCARSKLEFIKQEIENQNFPKIIKDLFRNLQSQVQESFHQMENIMLNRHQNFLDKICDAQNQLNQLINHFDMKDKKQWKHIASFAISKIENILPNLSIYKLEINDVQKLLQQIEIIITNLCKSTDKLKEKKQIDQQIQLYKLVYKQQYIPCITHKNNLEEYICTNLDCLDKVLGCRICMDQWHIEHNLLQYDVYEKDQANKSIYLKQINEVQIKILKNWEEFVTNNMSEFQIQLLNNINEQIDQRFIQITEYSTNYPIQYIQDDFEKVQEQLKPPLQAKLNKFLVETTLLAKKLIQGL